MEVNNCESRLKNLKSHKLELKKVLIYAFQFSVMGGGGGANSLTFNVVQVDDIISKFYMDHFLMMPNLMPTSVVLCL